MQTFGGGIVNVVQMIEIFKRIWHMQMFRANGKFVGYHRLRISNPTQACNSEKTKGPLSSLDSVSQCLLF